MAVIITLPLSSQLTNGTTADATQVMADLNAIANSVNLNAAPLATTANSATLAASSGASLIGFLQSGTGAVARNLQAKNSDWVSIKDFGAVGDGVADDTAAINATIAAVVAGGMLYIPVGTYLVSGSLLINKPINVFGSGWGSQILVAATMSATTDVFLIQPTVAMGAGGMQYVKFSDIRIIAKSGTPARYGIGIDGTNGPLGYMQTFNIRIDQLGSNAIGVSNITGVSATGTPFTSNFFGGVLTGGLNLNYCGDNVSISHVTMPGNGNITVNAVPPGSDGGSHCFLMSNCNITLSGMLTVKNAWTGTVQFCNFEQSFTSTNPNNCVIDLQGTAGYPLTNFKVVGNFIGATAAFVADGVRYGYTNSAIVENNYFSRGAGVDHRVTVNADRSFISMNKHAPAGELIAVYVDDQGTNTQIEHVSPATGTRSISVPFALNSGALYPFAVNGSQVKVSQSSVLGFTNSSDASNSGADTGFSRAIAGLIAVGNGTLGDVSGGMQLTKIQFASGATLRSGSGAPAISGNAGDFFLRIDTPTVANQRIYINIGGSWSGIV